MASCSVTRVDAPARGANMTFVSDKLAPRPAPPVPIKTMIKPEPGAIIGGRGNAGK